MSGTSTTSLSHPPSRWLIADTRSSGESRSCSSPVRAITTGAARVARCRWKLPGPKANLGCWLEEIAVVPPSDEGAMAECPAATGSARAMKSSGETRGRSEWMTTHCIPRELAHVTPSRPAASSPGPDSSTRTSPAPAAHAVTSRSAVTIAGSMPADSAASTVRPARATPSRKRCSGVTTEPSRPLPVAKDRIGIRAAIGIAAESNHGISDRAIRCRLCTPSGDFKECPRQCGTEK